MVQDLYEGISPEQHSFHNFRLPTFHPKKLSFSLFVIVHYQFFFPQRFPHSMVHEGGTREMEYSSARGVEPLNPEGVTLLQRAAWIWSFAAFRFLSMGVLSRFFRTGVVIMVRFPP